ncbi:unnamed protein product, partial [Ixodes pacificus]
MRLTQRRSNEPGGTKRQYAAESGWCSRHHRHQALRRHAPVKVANACCATAILRCVAGKPAVSSNVLRESLPPVSGAHAFRRSGVRYINFLTVRVWY